MKSRRGQDRIWHINLACASHVVVVAVQLNVFMLISVVTNGIWCVCCIAGEEPNCGLKCKLNGDNNSGEHAKATQNAGPDYQ